MSLNLLPEQLVVEIQVVANVFRTVKVVEDGDAG